ncbi:hypothetical protein RJ639_011839 [Escallonia herrerae]|uniref:Uncharacterized protein n=1 Tax=Escallonia herrerae TaxID=1293975 RepID=A0AA88VMR9_9ASTE|nr:hypothetical protein RJ639_011839 [Escallonia herrerae]
MITLAQTTINFSTFSTPSNNSHRRLCYYENLPQPISYYSLSRSKYRSLHQHGLRTRVSGGLSFLEVGIGKDGILVEGLRDKNKKRRMAVVRLNQQFGFNGGGGGGGDDGNTARLLGNIAFAIGLTYLSVTGQLGWVLDAIVSVWLLAVILPIVGLGAFIWWAGRDIVQSSVRLLIFCPNCGNDFQIFKSTLNDELQLCPFCSQPFSVVGDKFVSDPVTFSNQSTTFGQAFSEFSPGSKKGTNLFGFLLPFL